MAILNIYSVKDIKMNSFGVPFFKDHEIQARRDFERLSTDPMSHVKTYPTDFELWQLGEIDVNTGKIKNELTFICNTPRPRTADDKH